MKVFGRTTVSEFLGDFVVYRNLVPVDKRLPALDDIREQTGLPPGQIPRKSEPAYARIIVQMLKAARALDRPETSLRRLVYVGDTHLNDGTAFANICQAGNWPGMAFIGTETTEPARMTPSTIAKDRTLYLANRWAALAEFDRCCAEQGFPIDASTAVIVDLDKTALGARGRNAHVIDQARVLAVRHTVADLLGDDFDEAAFVTAYDRLNAPEFHPFTTDNQDYLAYICLILGSGLYKLEKLVSDVRDGQLGRFKQFIAQVNQRINEMPLSLAAVHSEIYTNVRASDPTPFKPFRYNEYQTTVARMGQLDDDTPVDWLLAEEIVITQKVRAQALAWRDQDALLFGLSDKPDEASIPSAELAAQGYAAIHQTETHAVGQ